MTHVPTHLPIGLRAKTIRAVAGSAALLALALGASAAAATEYNYHYVGNNFTEFAANPSQWKDTDRVELRLTLPAPIPPNVSNYAVDLTNSTIEITDGVKTYTRNIPAGSGNLPAGSGAQFLVWTNSDGKFVQWSFGVSEANPSSIGQTRYSVATLSTSDQASQERCDRVSDGECLVYNQIDGAPVRNNPGTWSLTVLQTVTTDLVAGQKIPVGAVQISQNPATCTATVTLKTTYPWCITEAHLATGETLGDIPQTRKGNPIPGQFADSAYPACEGQVVFENVTGGSLFAVHAVVYDTLNGTDETAWGAGTAFAGKNWATYVELPGGCQSYQ